MSGILSIMDKEIISIRKEKTIVLAILIQLLIASFSSVILVGLMSYYDPQSIGQNTNIHFNVGVVGDADGTLTSYLREAKCNVTAFGNEGNALALLKDGKLDAVIVIPSGSGVVDMRLYMPQADSRATVFTMVVDEPLKKYENYLRAQNGVQVHYTGMQGRPSTTYEFLYSFIVPMLMFFPAFIAGSMIIDSIAEEVENKTLDTLMAAPVSLSTIMFGKAAAAVFIAIIQCILWVILLSLNHLYIQNVALVLLVALIVSGLVTFGSALVSLYFKDRERAQFAYSILLTTGAGASLFFSPSPISLIARLAMGDTHVGLPDVLVFAVPLIVLMAIFYYAPKKLLAYKA